MQAAYLASRGYSLGYNFAVYPDGSAWEIRGWDIRSAANGGTDVNKKGVAILLAVQSVRDAPTDEMIAGVQDIIFMTRQRVHRSLAINGHCDVRPTPTACPGSEIVDMIARGVFEPGAEAPPPLVELPKAIYRLQDLLGERPMLNLYIHGIPGVTGDFALLVGPNNAAMLSQDDGQQYIDASKPSEIWCKTQSQFDAYVSIARSGDSV
jgi:hypothetical protein